MAQGLNFHIHYTSICERSNFTFYTLPYLQLYNIVDFRSYFIFLYMLDPFILLCSSKLFIRVYVCESVSKLSLRKLVLNSMGITQSLIVDYIVLFRVLIQMNDNQYNKFYNGKGIVGILFQTCISRVRVIGLYLY